MIKMRGIKEMKKRIAFLLSVLCIIVLAGCSNNSAPDTSPLSPPANSAPNTPSSVPPVNSVDPSALTIESTTPKPSAETTPLPEQPGIPIEPTTPEENTEMKLHVQIGDYTFKATLEDNAAAGAFVEMIKQAPVVIQMSDNGGFEKVGPLGQTLPTSNSQITAQSGDIILYNANQIVIFYGSNSWSYTRLGRIDDLTGWTEALGRGNVTVTFSLGE